MHALHEHHQLAGLELAAVVHTDQIRQIPDSLHSVNNLVKTADADSSLDELAMVANACIRSRHQASMATPWWSVILRF